MKPIASHMTEVDNIEGKEVAFRISEANAGWVMRSMADLYSNRELAVVREYSTNAYDSNIEAALKGGYEPVPIKVSLPSAMNPYFSVQDFGVGMSEHELMEIYTQFGASTKRESDDFNGMLGFGSKSAVAYTNTFTVTAVKDGMKTIAVVTRKEDYRITLKVVMPATPTNEGNGVTIQVPVHNHAAFAHIAKDFYRFWKPGTVEVNGVEPKWAVGDKIGDNLYYYPEGGTSYVVMGNVPYRIANPDALFPRGMNKISFVAYVPNGAVEFTPSREDLKYSEHTKQALHKVINDFASEVVENAKREIGAAKTHSEAFSAWYKWRKVIGAGNIPDLTFNGDKLIDSFKIEADRYDSHASRYNTWAVKEWEIINAPQTLIVTHFTANLASSQKAKVKAWMNHVGVSARWVLFTQEKSVDTPWFDQNRVVTWDKVKDEAPKAPKKPRQQSAAWGRKAGTFDLISVNGKKSEQDVPNVTPLYYIMVQEYNRVRYDISTVLKEFGINEQVVIVPANRKDKFLRNYPKALPLMDELKKKINLNGPSLIPAEGMIYLSTHHDERRLILALNPTEIDDPAVVKLHDIIKKGEVEYLREYNRQERLSRLVGLHASFKQHQYRGYWDAKNRPLTNEYPLCQNVRDNSSFKKHVYFYMNSLYKARKAGINV